MQMTSGGFTDSHCSTHKLHHYHVHLATGNRLPEPITVSSTQETLGKIYHVCMMMSFNALDDRTLELQSAINQELSEAACAQEHTRLSHILGAGL